MDKQPRKRPGRWGYLILTAMSAVAVITILAAVFNWGRFIGPAVLGLFAAGIVILFAFSDAIDAWSNERYVEANPEHVYSEDIGRTVKATTDFSSASTSSTGKVSLGGETWDAICEGESVPREGDELIVERRDGLKLIVSPANSDVDSPV